MKYLILIALLASGCSQKVVTTQDINTIVEQNTTTKVKYTGTRAKEKLLGIELACAEKRTEWGYTKEQCKEDWGRELIIDWGYNAE